MSHTKEPWDYGEDNDGWYAEKNGVQLAHGLTEDNARRIVACVNACANLTTEYLESNTALPQFNQLVTMALQRDELLAVLKDVLHTREQEAKAQRAYDVANENYSDPKPESEAWGRAMIEASTAEKRALAIIAKVKP